MYRILIADDERLEREAFKFMIHKGIDFPIEIQEAVNGREAIVKARTFKPDIVFMDIKMPGIDGIDAARSIKDEFPMVQLVFLTAFNIFEYARDAIHIGASDFLIKPATEKKVLEVTESLILKVDQLQKELNSRKNNELKLNRAADYLENEFVYALAVKGINQDKFFNYISFLDLSFFAGRGGIMKVLFDTYPLHVETDYQKFILKKRCTFILKKTLAVEGIGLLSNLELSSVYFLMNLDEKKTCMSDPDVRFLLQAIEEEIRLELSIVVKIGAGSTFLDPGDALSSFSWAIKNLDITTVPGPNPDYSVVNKQGCFPMNLEIEMEKAVLKGEREEAVRNFQKIDSWFNLSGELFSVRKQYILELATVLKHSAACQFPDGNCTADDSELRTAEKPVLLLASFRIFLNDLLDRISRIQEAEYNPAINVACAYIEDNFSKDISLEDAAELCRLSSFYFSKLFKKRKKITFIEYLTNRRMKEAKSLLTGTNLSIKEISREVGYNDPNYFTRVFKRTEKISPTSYRNKKMQSRQ